MCARVLAWSREPADACNSVADCAATEEASQVMPPVDTSTQTDPSPMQVTRPMPSRTGSPVALTTTVLRNSAPHDSLSERSGALARRLLQTEARCKALQQDM